MLNFFNGSSVLVKVMVPLSFIKLLQLYYKSKKEIPCYITYGLVLFGKVTIYHQNGVKYGRYHVQSRKIVSV
jgi:hypothetical protein